MKKMEIVVDKRLELLSVLAFLSDYDSWLRELVGGYPENTNELAVRAKEYFSPWKNHEAVTLLDRLSREHTFVFDAPVNLFLSSPMEQWGEESLQLPSDVLLRCSDLNFLSEMLVTARDFYDKSGFSEFYNDNRELYNSCIAGVREKFKGYEPGIAIEEFTGLSCSSFRIIIAPMLLGNYGGYSRKGNEKHLHSVLCPVFHDKLFLGDSYNLCFTSTHEFLHGFINDLTEKYFSTDKEKSLQDIVDENMKKKCYPTVSCVINETVIDAITIHLLEEKEGRESSLKAIQSHEDRGYRFIRQIYEKMGEYKNERHNYTSLDDFYPQILELFEVVSLKKV